MQVEQLLEHMDKHIEILNDSVDRMVSYPKNEVKELYGSIQTYKECLNMERGALTSMISLRQWIVNKHSVEMLGEELRIDFVCS
jgi:hypothetical protein